MEWPIGTSFYAGTSLALEDIPKAGIKAIELTWQPLDIFKEEIKQLCDTKVAEARRVGLTVWSVHIPFGTDWDPSQLDEEGRTEAVRKAGEVLRLAGEWGVKAAVIHPSWEPVPSEERPERLKACRYSLALLAGQAQELGIRLAAECLPRTCLGNTADEMEYLLEGSPLLGVCCDVNHLLQERPEQFIRQIGRRIVTTHLSDNDGTDEKHWLPGNGIIDWRAVMESLAAAGYSGPFLYEVRNPDPELLRANWEALVSKQKIENNLGGNDLEFNQGQI